MEIKRVFDREVEQRQAEKESTISLRQAQRYIIRELRQQFAKLEDEEAKEKISLLDKAFRCTLYPAVMKELNSIRRAGIYGDILVKRLTEIYQQYNLKSLLEQEKKAKQSK